MNITAHEDLGGRWHLWDGDTYLADCGVRSEGESNAKAIRDGFAALREDNAALLIALREIDSSQPLPSRVQRLLNRIREAEHPGRALMGELTRRMSDLEQERDAARGVVEAARSTLGAPLFEHQGPLETALAVYDEAVKGDQ